MIIGGAVVTNGNKKSNFFIENKVPILRQKDIMGVKEADSLGQSDIFYYSTHVYR